MDFILNILLVSSRHGAISGYFLQVFVLPDHHVENRQQRGSSDPGSAVYHKKYL